MLIRVLPKGEISVCSEKKLISVKLRILEKIVDYIIGDSAISSKKTPRNNVDDFEKIVDALTDKDVSKLSGRNLTKREQRKLKKLSKKSSRWHDQFLFKLTTILWIFQFVLLSISKVLLWLDAFILV